MRTEDFTFLSRAIYERSGLVLTPDKAYLFESRLMPLARRHGMKTLDELIAMIRGRSDAGLLRAVTEAMTTNETLFFRDGKPFEQFRRLILPDLLKKRAGRPIRIWSAACSSGQEPYSLAMVLREEHSQLGLASIEIVATDISLEMIERARAGTYTQFEVQRGLPIAMLMKHFRQVGDRWQLSSDVMSMVQFREFNLLGDPRSLGQFDVVLCRNVLIYFDPPTKRQVLERIASVMAPDGVLYLGGAETVLGVTDRFEPDPSERGLHRLATTKQTALRQVAR